MIVLDLLCDAGHRFEGWFTSPEAFEKQREGRILSCPTCGTQDVHRLPSAPHVPKRTQQEAPPRKTGEELLRRLREIAGACEDVGGRFPDEARRIHYGDAEARPIRGQASLNDTLGLLEEGITVMPLPATKEDLH